MFTDENAVIMTNERKGKHKYKLAQIHAEPHLLDNSVRLDSI